jgi:hypothetical protein
LPTFKSNKFSSNIQIKEFIPAFKFLIPPTKFDRIETSLEFVASSRSAGSGGLRDGSRVVALEALVVARRQLDGGGQATVVGQWPSGGLATLAERLAEEEVVAEQVCGTGARASDMEVTAVWASSMEAATVWAAGKAVAMRENGFGVRNQKTEEEIWRFPNRSVYRWVIAVCPTPHIFVGVVPSPTNIHVLYSLVS